MLWTFCVLLSVHGTLGYIVHSPSSYAWRRPTSAITTSTFSSLSQRPLPCATTRVTFPTQLYSETTTPSSTDSTTTTTDYVEPEDAVIHIKPPAMIRLRELKSKQSPDAYLVLRMGVRNGGCSGLSYVMDFSTEAAIEEEDAVDDYEAEGIKCVVDAKSMLYLYGLELDFSDELIGGGFKFFNPNAEDSCGCGSSFGV